MLNDGAKTGERDLDGRVVPVFNALQRLQASQFQTFTVFVWAESEQDIDELCETRLPGLGNVEDWTDSITHYCLRCSYGTPHNHVPDAPVEQAWEPERNIGIAAQSRITVERLLQQWAKASKGRRVDAIEQREHPLTAPEDGTVWWRMPDDEEENDADEGRESAAG